jgi:nitroreductase
MKILFSAAVALCFAMSMNAQDIKLPAPHRTGGKPLMDVLNNRQSMRTPDPAKEISQQVLSDLLWAAWGYNREDKRTAPSSMNRQEIDLYVVTAKGAYMYDAKNNVLKAVAEGDFRKETGMQAFVGVAPLNIVFVCDKSRMKSKDEQGMVEATYANSGFISQNIYLFCASEGLATVIRASIPKDNLAKVLRLRADQLITLAQTVGYSKE